MISGAGKVRFDRVNDAALRHAEAVVRALLPQGRREGTEWVALNPHRADHKVGSFKVNLVTGKWGDFSSGDRGGDLISLAAFLTRASQREACIRLAESLGVHPYEH